MNNACNNNLLDSMCNFLWYFVISIMIYSIFVYIIKRVLYPFKVVYSKTLISTQQKGYGLTFLISPDYWWALHFKSRIEARGINERMKKRLKVYVQMNNKINVGVSIVIMLLCFASYGINPDSFPSKILMCIAFIRFISRSYEITCAFVCDIFQKQKSVTGLNKYERIRLALFSYLEIFFYSAAAYMLLPQITSAYDAVTVSLSVGTLTNVGYAFNFCGQNTPFITNIVFVQVFATLSLVVLSLAAYLSRKDGNT